MIKSLKIGNLTAHHPIIQGGMGVGISLSSLAGAVASEGGVGVISAAQTGFNWGGFDSNPLKANLKALAHHIKRAKTLAKDGIIGVNIMHALANYSEYVKCTIKNGADLIISGAGLPTNLPELVADTTTKIAPIISSAKAAKILLSLWEKKYNRTADMIIIEGPKAGGHLGFSQAELDSDANFDEKIEDILQEVSKFESRFNKAIPTVFAGGVHDSKDTAHYMRLGCAGVQVATRFVATYECDAAEGFKQAYIQAKESDVVITKSPVGMLGRAISNAFIKSLLVSKPQITRCHGCIDHCNRAEIPYCISGALINSARGQTENGLVFCGANVHRISEVTSVREVMRDLVAYNE